MSKDDIFLILMCFLATWILIILSGCAGFIPLKEKPFHKAIILPETVIHIQDVCYTKDGRKVAGWYDPVTGDICVWAAKWSGEFELVLETLGHEITHKLNHIDQEIRSPDN